MCFVWLHFLQMLLLTFYSICELLPILKPPLCFLSSCSFLLLHAEMLLVTSITFFFFPPPVLEQSPLEIIAYVDGTVTLPTGSKFSPIKVLWFIFSNVTGIANYQSGKSYTNLFPQYTNRLSIDESTGKYTPESMSCSLLLCSSLLMNVCVLQETWLSRIWRWRIPSFTD